MYLGRGLLKSGVNPFLLFHLCKNLRIQLHRLSRPPADVSVMVAERLQGNHRLRLGEDQDALFVILATAL